MEINVVDTTDSWFRKPIIQLTEWRKIVIEMTLGPNGVQRMVDAIIRRAGSPGVITVLRIYAHGRSGAINIAGGKIDAQDQLSGIGLESLPRLTGTLQSLTPYFAPSARVELQGCRVARGSDGEKLMLKLAKIWRAKVQASPEPASIGAVQFAGVVTEANPAGGLACVPRTELTRD